MLPTQPPPRQLIRIEGRQLLARRIEAGQTDLLDVAVNISRFKLAHAFGHHDHIAAVELSQAMRHLERAKATLLLEGVR